MRLFFSYHTFSVLFALVVVAAPQGAVTPSGNQLVVSVGDGGASFTPDSVTAKPGDEILFVFRMGNHSVTQTSFSSPCTPLVDAPTGRKGFDSGFFPSNPSSGELPGWKLEVTSSDPIWIACMQTIGGRHCESGMVMVINPPADQTVDSFRAAAKNPDKNGALVRSPFAGWSIVAGASIVLSTLFM